MNSDVRFRVPRHGAKGFVLVDVSARWLVFLAVLGASAALPRAAGQQPMDQPAPVGQADVDRPDSSSSHLAAPLAPIRDPASMDRRLPDVPIQGQPDPQPSLSGTIVEALPRTAPPESAGRPDAIRSVPPAIVEDPDRPAIAVQWIWSDQHAHRQVPSVSCYFRKTFTLARIQSAQLEVAADDAYELHVNGRRQGSGGAWDEFDSYDVAGALVRGENTIAVCVHNRKGNVAGLAARLTVVDAEGRRKTLVTDATWKTSLRPLPLWALPQYSDRRWQSATAIGPFGTTEPWIVENEETVPDGAPADVATSAQSSGDTADAAQSELSVAETPGEERPDDGSAETGADPPDEVPLFTIDREFQVQQVVADDQTGSLIAMAFNEFGQLIASREGGPLLLVFDSDDDGTPDTSRVYCEAVTNCQGILALSGDVFVTGDGPEGAALYRLRDADTDGMLDVADTLIRFEKKMGEFGPHGLTLGPDGMIYLVIGDLAEPVCEFAPSSPSRGYYEGDLVRPRYEDPGGHAVGVTAPGGSILRCDVSGETVERVAGGLRNPYDLAFDRQGDLFTHDSDMEWDEGTPWYRPNRLHLVLSGAEFGWRSGWAKWPDYFVDSLPAIVDSGLGSPTGIAVYDHVMMPSRYHGAVFSCDWSHGRILVFRALPAGAGKTATPEVFLSGKPLPVTDVGVGPDGWLYFVTGGRGAKGGVYRITWAGDVPEQMTQFGEGIARAIRFPQLDSAWARQEVAMVKQQLGHEQWSLLLHRVVRNTKNRPEYRTRALDLLQLLGPRPTPALLIELSNERDVALRRKAAFLMGLSADDRTQARLVELLADRNAATRRQACESLVRAGQTAPVDQLMPLLGRPDRFEAWAARRLLETIPGERWHEAVLTSDDHRVFVQGATAMMIADPTRENGLRIAGRVDELLDGFITDRNFIDILRVAQIAIAQGKLTADDLPELRDSLAGEFPAGDPIINRELVRLLVPLGVDSIMDRYTAYLGSNISETEKLHVASQLRFLDGGWTTDAKLQVLGFLEQSRNIKGGRGVPRYVENVTRDFARSLTPDEAREVFNRADRWPTAALGAIAKLPPQLDDALFSQVERLDRQTDTDGREAVRRLRIGLVAVLARDGQERSVRLLRDVFERDPERREHVVLGLLLQSGDENWDYFVRSLPVLGPHSAPAVLRKLRTMPEKPDSPGPVRQVILHGLKLDRNGGQYALALLEYWTGENPAAPEATVEQALAAWQAWFAASYPDQPPAELPAADEKSKWEFDELIKRITDDRLAPGDPVAGAEVFRKAQCVKCHRYGDEGETLGPDLTGVMRRFQKKEVLQSIVYPSHVIAEQYASQLILTDKGLTLTGIVGPGAAGELVVLQTDMKKVTVGLDEIEEQAPSKTSTMPTNLLNELELAEIVDLFAFLNNPPDAKITARPEDKTRH